MVAVPWAVYSPSADPNVLTVTVERDRIYNAPVFDYARVEEYSRPDYISNVYSYYGVSGERQLELVFLAVLQRPQPAQRRQLARQQVGIQQAQQQARREVSRCKGRPLPTPQKAEEHIRVRLRPRAQQQSGRVKQLLPAFPSELVNERPVRKKSRGSQLRQVVAAKPERDLKVRKLRQSRPLLVKRQPGRSVARRVSARLSLREKPPETNNKFRYLNFAANQPGTSERRAFFVPHGAATSFCLLRRRYRLGDISRPKAM